MHSSSSSSSDAAAAAAVMLAATHEVDGTAAQPVSAHAADAQLIRVACQEQQWLARESDDDNDTRGSGSRANGFAVVTPPATYPDLQASPVTLSTSAHSSSGGGSTSSSSKRRPARALDGDDSCGEVTSATGGSKGAHVRPSLAALEALLVPGSTWSEDAAGGGFVCGGRGSDDDSTLEAAAQAEHTDRAARKQQQAQQLGEVEEEQEQQQGHGAHSAQHVLAADAPQQAWGAHQAGAVGACDAPAPAASGDPASSTLARTQQLLQQSNAAFAHNRFAEAACGYQAALDVLEGGSGGGAPQLGGDAAQRLLWLKCSLNLACAHLRQGHLHQCVAACDSLLEGERERLRWLHGCASHALGGSLFVCVVHTLPCQSRV
jgi:hypothetical protein